MSLFVGLGSNLGDSRRILSKAVHHLSQSFKVLNCSSLYRSQAQGYVDQPDFYNAVVELCHSESDSPMDILRKLRTVQDVHANAKSPIRFGPRELDIDLIAFKPSLQYKNDDILEIPHPRAHLRDFVVRPLCELDKDVRLGPDFVPAGDLTIAENLCHKLPPQMIWGSSTTSKSDLPLIMAVLNITPDSFSDGGKYLQVDDAVKHAIQLVEDGADIIDIGGQSTRPFAPIISEQEELDRVLPVIEQLNSVPSRQTFRMSIDTRKPKVAREAVNAGVDIINDEVGELDDESLEMARLAAELGVPFITMHARGDSQTMEDSKLDGNVCNHVLDWLESRAQNCLHHGVPRWNVMIDPGLGFAKSNEQNLEILKRLGSFSHNYPVLVGASRKRFVKELTKFDVDVATSAVTAWAAIGGASAVRVHSVRHAVDTVNVISRIGRAA